MYTKEPFDVCNFTDRSDYSILSELVDGSPAIPAYSDSEIDASVYHSFSFDYPCSYSSVLGQGTDHLEFRDAARGVIDESRDPGASLNFQEFDITLITNIFNPKADVSKLSSDGPALESYITNVTQVAPATPPVSVTMPAPSLSRSIGSLGNLSQFPTPPSLAGDKKPEGSAKQEMKTLSLKSAPQSVPMKKTGNNVSRVANGKAQYKFLGALEVLKHSMQLIYRALKGFKPKIEIPGNVMDSLAQQTDTHVHILSKDRKLFHWLETERPKEVIQTLLQIPDLDGETKSKLTALVSS